ncbi:hypothetical protein N9L68_06165 [bacterium]|nr:hypothetical protein [bacterium]
MTWLGTYEVLRSSTSTLDASALIHQWNRQRTKAAQFKGTKKSSLMNLLDHYTQ